MAQNAGKQNKNRASSVNISTMVIIGTKQIENIVLSSYCHQQNSYGKKRYRLF